MSNNHKDTGMEQQRRETDHNEPHYMDNAGIVALHSGLLLSQFKRGETIRPAGISCIDYAIRDLTAARKLIQDAGE